MGGERLRIRLANVLRERALDLAVTGFALGLAVGLKAFYRRAGFDDLRWVLDPAVRLAERLGAGPFELEAHHGWLDRTHHFEVVPACAGVNFLIVVFLSLCLGLAPARAGLGGRLAFVAASTALAYVATLLANATRWAIAIRLQDSVGSGGPLPAARVQEATGIAVFFVVLVLVYASVGHMLRVGPAALRR